jgi:hypothetical protein
MAGKKRRASDSSDEPAQKKKKSGAGLWIGLGGGCAVLLLVLVCGGGAVGVWIWKNPGGDKGIEKGIENVIHDVKAKNPVKGTASLGKVPLTELGPEIQFWDFAIRLPKGMIATVDNVPGNDGTATYQWHRFQPAALQINCTKMKLATKMSPLELIGTSKFKSDEKDPFKFDTIHMPQPVEINGLNGARSWVWMEQGPANHKVTVTYRYHIDGWAYLFQCPAPGTSMEAARQNADLVDVAVCTFRKR